LAPFLLAAEKFVENVADILKIESEARALFKVFLLSGSTPGPSKSSGARISVRARAPVEHVPELVVLGSLSGIGKYLVGLIHLFELLLIAPFVGVIFMGQLAVCFFNIVGRSVAAYSEYLIVICHCYFSSSPCSFCGGS
jgi:hypothetical protein